MFLTNYVCLKLQTVLCSNFSMNVFCAFDSSHIVSSTLCNVSPPWFKAVLDTEQALSHGDEPRLLFTYFDVICDNNEDFLKTHLRFLMTLEPIPS